MNMRTVTLAESASRFLKTELACQGGKVSPDESPTNRDRRDFGEAPQQGTEDRESEGVKEGNVREMTNDQSSRTAEIGTGFGFKKALFFRTFQRLLGEKLGKRRLLQSPPRMGPMKTPNLSNLSPAESLEWSLSDQILPWHPIDSSCVFSTSGDCRNDEGSNGRKTV
jgi:hypothetical protein